MSIIFRLLPISLLGLGANLANAGIVDDCFNLTNSQQYAKAEALGRQAVKQLGGFDAHICLGKALENQGKASEALPIFQTASNLARSDADIRIAANWLGNTFSALGNDEAALEQHNRELAIAKRQNSKSEEATALNNVALIYGRKGDTKRALQYYEEALRIQPDEGKKTTVLSNVALMYSAQGDHKKAISKLEEAVAISRRLGDHHSLGRHLLNIGSIRRKSGDLQGANRDLDEGLTYVRQVGDKGWEASGSVGLARLREDQGELVLARQAWEQSTRNYRLIKDDENARWSEEQGSRLSSAQGCKEFSKDGKAALAQNIAEAALKKSGKDAGAWLCLGKLEHIRKNYTDATKAFAHVERFSMDKTEKAIALDWSGWAYSVNNDFSNARLSSVKALQLARETKMEATEGSALENLIIVERDDPKGNKHKFSEYCMQLDVMRDTSSTTYGWTWQSCGNMSRDAEDWPVAIRRYEKAIPIYQSKGEIWGEIQSRIYLGRSLFNQASYEQSRDETEQGLKLLIEKPPAWEQKILADWKGYAMSTLGSIAERENKLEEAKTHYQQSLEQAHIEGDQGKVETLVKKLAELEPPTAQAVVGKQPVESVEIQPTNESQPTNLQQQLTEGLGKLFGTKK